MAKELTPTDLLEAASGGDVGEVMKLLDMSSTDQSEYRDDRSARLNVRDRGDDRTAFHLAVDETNIVAIKTLVRAGADFNLSDRTKQTPLILALLNGRTSCAGELINLGADINCVADYGLNALILAVLGGYEDCLQLLIGAGADLSFQVRHNYSPDYFELTALMLAAKRHQLNCLKLLLEAGADVNLKTSDGETALHYACKFSYQLRDAVVLECAKILLTFGADVTMISSTGQTVLMYAVRDDSQVHILPILVEAGAIVDQQDSSGMTALAHAVSRGTHECVGWLVDHGASVSIRDYSGKTLLHFPMFDSNNDTAAKKCVEILLNKQQLDVNATDKAGMTPLMCVAKKSERGKDTMAILLENGAELNVMDNKGQTAFIYSLRLDTSLPDSPSDFRVTFGIIFLIDKGANLSQGQIASGHLSSLVLLQRDLDLIKLQVGNTVDLKAQWDQIVLAIKDNKRKILQFLIINGVMPSPPGPHDTLKSKDRLTTASLLETVAVKYNLGMLKYFVATCYLRDEDLKFSTRKHVGNHALFRVMNDLRNQPWPLVKLCFVVVSTVFGASPGRQERVKNSQLPVQIQTMLLFQEPWSRLCVHQWDKIPLTFNPENYEKLPRPRPLLYHWPVGQALVPCDCKECDGTMYKYEG